LVSSIDFGISVQQHLHGFYVSIRRRFDQWRVSVVIPAPRIVSHRQHRLQSLDIATLRRPAHQMRLLLF
jgi:hypothetical protein